MKLVFLSAICFILCGCDAPDLDKQGAVSKTDVDVNGVVCYTTRHRGEFSCVKVK